MYIFSGMSTVVGFHMAFQKTVSIGCLSQLPSLLSHSLFNPPVLASLLSVNNIIFYFPF